jgi:hypothetical protein
MAMRIRTPCVSATAAPAPTSRSRATWCSDVRHYAPCTARHEADTARWRAIRTRRCRLRQAGDQPYAEKNIIANPGTRLFVRRCGPIVAMNDDMPNRIYVVSGTRFIGCISTYSAAIVDDSWRGRYL